MQGMNVDAVRGIANGLEAQAQALESITHAVDAVVGEMRYVWLGRRSQEFEGWWAGQHRATLVTAAQQVRELGKSAHRNADEQEQVSSVGGGSSTPGPAPSAPPAAVPTPGAALLTSLTEAFKDVSDSASAVGAAAGLGVVSALTHLGDSANKDISSLDLFTKNRLGGWINFLESNAPLNGLGKALGAVSVGDNALQTWNAYQQGNFGETAYSSADTLASGLKMSKIPPVYLGGVAVSVLTDLVREAEKIDLNPPPETAQYMCPFNVDNLKNVWAPSIAEAFGTVLGRVPSYL